MTNAVERTTGAETSGSVAAEATTEVNFDGLPGPTHNYSGLATGNLASERHKSRPANPRQALSDYVRTKQIAPATVRLFQGGRP